jgi:hypothetical protein
MTKLTPLAGPLKTLTITLQSPQETLQGTPTTLPTSEPSEGNEQITCTVQSSDLPTFSVSPGSKVWVAYVYAGGKFVTAGSLYWRMKKNGVSVANGSGTVSANLYYTRLFCFYNVEVGDVLKISLWSNRSDSNWDYNAYFVYPTRICVSSRLRAMLNVTYTNMQYTALTLGAPHVYNVASSYTCHDDLLNVNTAEDQKVTLLYNGKTNDYGLFRVTHGDALSADGSPTQSTDASYRPNYWREDIPTTITFRFLDIPAV